MYILYSYDIVSEILAQPYSISTLETLYSRLTVYTTTSTSTTATTATSTIDSTVVGDVGYQYLRLISREDAIKVRTIFYCAV